MTLIRNLSCFLTLALPLAAQQADARSYVPPGFTVEAFVDFAALKEHELWDAIRGSAVGSLFGMAEQELGFELADLDKLYAFPETGRKGEGLSQGGLMIMVGNDSVTLPPNQSRCEEGKLGDYQALLGKYGDDPDHWVQIRPGLLLMGTNHIVRPLLAKEVQPGVPEGDMLALTSVKGSMAHLVMAITDEMLDDLPFPVPEGVLQQDDKPQFFMIRLRLQPGASADEEPQVFLEAALRHVNGSKGPAALKGLADQGLAEAKKHPRLAAFKQFWSKIELRTDGRDLALSLPLGRPRDAAGQLVMLAAPLMMLGTTEAVPAPVEAAPEEKPAEEPKPAGGGRGGN
ncbi:MAG: hypothetical protein IPK26_01215 [Planctomycetes bacterium]|nr:hypothetical protein [Planctomycetota bacterium]